MASDALMSAVLLYALSLLAPIINAPRGPQDPPIGHSPTGIIRACAPDADVCDQIADACAADGMDSTTCKALASDICPGNKYMTCKAALAVCEQETGETCPFLEQVCAENFDACQPPSCKHAGTLTPAEAVAFCFATPGRLEQCGAEPDVGDCLELMTWKECKVTTCEWSQCMADLEEIGNQCPVDFPPSCIKIHKCDLAENNG